jgi:type IV pilus assembly protein PilV
VFYNANNGRHGMTQQFAISPLFRNRLNRETGFSLLEVMVALLVLSIGLLGIAGLQTYSLQFNHQSYERTQATLLISSMSEKIMANAMAAKAGGYDGVTAGLKAANYSGYGGCPAACANANELATYDLFLWKSAIEDPQILAQGTGAITRVIDGADANALIFDFTIQWVENGILMAQTMRIRTL